MTLAELQALVAESKGEGEQIEFKKSTGELHGGMETLCGLLNGSGGKVLFGVTNAGEIVGQDVTDSTFRSCGKKPERNLSPPQADRLLASTEQVCAQRIHRRTRSLSGPAYER